jgi:hypothetical protein
MVTDCPVCGIAAWGRGGRSVGAVQHSVSSQHYQPLFCRQVVLLMQNFFWFWHKMAAHDEQ